MTPKELYIKGLFHPKLMNEEEADSIVGKISSIGERFGFVGNQGNDDRRKHKYDVWIALQVKKELTVSPPPSVPVLGRVMDLFAILDWAIETKANLMSHTFDSAFEAQKTWLASMPDKGSKRSLPLDNERIIYTCSNGYFLYILRPEDLEYEASEMGHCVGGSNFKAKISNNRSAILSLRDRKNKPHVTIEVALTDIGRGEWKGVVVQQQGKGNLAPNQKYHEALREFALFSCNALDDETAAFLTE